VLHCSKRTRKDRDRWGEGTKECADAAATNTTNKPSQAKPKQPQREPKGDATCDTSVMVLCGFSKGVV
jgi:hypothetical protein